MGDPAARHAAFCSVRKGNDRIQGRRVYWEACGSKDVLRPLPIPVVWRDTPGQAWKRGDALLRPNVDALGHFVTAHRAGGR